MKKFKLPAFLILSTIMLYTAGCDLANLDPSNEDPDAQISITSTDIEIGEPVQLDASASSDPDNDALTYSWTLDTPAGSNTQLNNDTSEQVTFTPDVEGDYTVTLTVEDENDGTDTASETITVDAASMIIVDSNITENSTWSPDVTYRVTEVVRLSGAELIIEAGTQIEFEEAAGLFISSSGTLTVNGSSNNSVLFT
ncbi:MAG: PKD domain-containing protein, partial [Gracilimonas sp.]|nr:PKD domain-containing protein [Gracilimonas sp.]